MRRILLTVHKFFPQHHAGTETLTLQVARELRRRGNTVQVFTANPPDSDARRRAGPLTSDYVYDGVPVHVVEESLRTSNLKFEYEYFHPIIGEHFRKALRSFSPDLVHIFHAQNLSGSIIQAAKEEGLPVVCSATDFWFVCPIVQLRRTDGAICTGPSHFAANCLTCYTPVLFPQLDEFVQAVEEKHKGVGGVLKKTGILKRALYRLLHAAYVWRKLPRAAAATMKRPYRLKELANRTDAIMVPTRLMHDLFVINGIDERLIHHVPFGLDLERLRPVPKSHSERLRIGYIGSISEHKGVDLLVDAFQLLPADAPAELIVYGDLDQFGQYGRQLVARVTGHNLSSGRVRFPGAFPNAELGQRLSEIDVLVVPSRWYENAPLVIQSAFAAKTPVIATNLGGMSELVKHGVNGLLFELNDAGGLLECLARLLSEPELLKKLAEGIAPERSIAAMVDDIEAIYYNLNPRQADKRRITASATHH